MRELVEFVARSLVDSPDEVRVSQTGRDASSSVIELQVAPDDLGKVIGRQGRTVRALRTLLSAASARSSRRITLDIVD
ncbi:MAG TPA: KH domain-containing protein [Thermoanaerobaculia bacterium]|nr:KH domain-containing protein [Thermoanaerobaculia bacterium]